MNQKPFSASPHLSKPTSHFDLPPYRPGSSHSAIYEIIRSIVAAFLLAMVIRTIAFEPFNIPSSSMLPNLLVGDYLFISKYSYGYSHHSLPLSFPLFEGRILFKSPRRGDVIVFKLPANNRVDYIKRLIGLPGDHIQVKNGILYINYQPVPRKDSRLITVQEGGREVEVTEYTETLPNGVSHRIWERSDQAPLDNTPEYTVPPGHYFMMGDNRDNSIDSRMLPSDQMKEQKIWSLGTQQTFTHPEGVGFVPAENLLGRAEVLFFSLKDGVKFYEVWKWPEALRFNRLGLHVR